MASNRPPKAVTLKKRQMYIDDPKNKIYEERVTVYRELLTKMYPDYFNWDLHCVILRKLVSSEILYEICDRKIQNDIDWTIMDVKLMEKAFDRMKWCYTQLGFPLEVQKRLKQAKAGLDQQHVLTLEEEMENLMVLRDMSDFEA